MKTITVLHGQEAQHDPLRLEEQGRTFLLQEEVQAEVVAQLIGRLPVGDRVDL